MDIVHVLTGKVKSQGVHEFDILDQEQITQLSKTNVCTYGLTSEVYIHLAFLLIYRCADALTLL